ncbi:MAG: tRNA pseudouridine(55) synthase TruB, partial [Bdellovibrionales bacterium]
DTISLEVLEKLEHIPAREAALKPVQVVLDDIPALEIQAGEITVLRNGQALSLISKSDFKRIEDLGDTDEAIAIHQDKAIAIVSIDGPQVKPVRVFNI